MKERMFLPTDDSDLSLVCRYLGFVTGMRETNLLIVVVLESTDDKYIIFIVYLVESTLFPGIHKIFSNTIFDEKTAATTKIVPAVRSVVP